MIAKKSTKKRNARGEQPKRPGWRDSLRRRLAKVPEIDGIYFVKDGTTVHVFTVIKEHLSEIYEPLMKQETLVEKDHPRISFDFHTREHQGRPSHQAVPHGAEAVFLRK